MEPGEIKPSICKETCIDGHNISGVRYVNGADEKAWQINLQRKDQYKLEYYWAIEDGDVLNFYCRPTHDNAQLFQSTVEVAPDVSKIVKAALDKWKESKPERCADCGKIDKLVKCSKEACENKICPTCVDRYSGKHCNSCYICVGSVEMAEWVFSRESPPSAIGVRIER
jgi:hypothetical protein